MALQHWSDFLDATINRQVRMQPDLEFVEDLYMRSRTTARSGEFEKAASMLAEATMLEAKLPEALEAYGDLLDVAGQSDLGISIHQERRRIRSRQKMAAPDRPMPLRQTRQFAAELAAYSTTARYVGDRAFVNIALGNAFLKRGLPHIALTHYNLVRHLKPNCSSSFTLSGVASFMMGAYDDALKSFDLALARNAKDVDAWGGRAMVLSAQGHVAAAAADWQRQFALLPPERASARACVALRAGDYASALPELLRAIDREPGNLYWQLYRLTAALRLGLSIDEFAPAVVEEWPGPLIALHAGRISQDELMEQACNSGRRVEALFQLGVLAWQGDRQKAREFWRQVTLESDPVLVEYAAANAELARLA